MSALQHEIGKKQPFDCLEQETMLNLVRTADIVGRDFTHFFERHGLTGPQYNVLRILRGHHDRSLSCQEIAGQMVSATPDITRLVDRLEAAGWVERRRTERDRRVVLISITPAGLAKLEPLDEPLLRLHRDSMKHLTSSEQAELNRLLVKLRQRPEASASPD